MAFAHFSLVMLTTNIYLVFFLDRFCEGNLGKLFFLLLILFTLRLLFDSLCVFVNLVEGPKFGPGNKKTVIGEFLLAPFISTIILNLKLLIRYLLWYKNNLWHQ